MMKYDGFHVCFGTIFRDSVTYNLYTTLDFCMLGSIIGKILLYVHVYNSQFETLNENIEIYVRT